MTDYKLVSRYVYLTVFGDGCVPVVKVGRSDYPVRRAKAILSQHQFNAYHICGLIWPCDSEKTTNALEAYLIRKNSRYRLIEYGREYFSAIQPVIASFLECLNQGWCNGLLGHPDNMVIYKYSKLTGRCVKPHFKCMTHWAHIRGYSLKNLALNL